MGRILIPGALRNIFKIRSKSTPDCLMNERLSDFDDIFILFMKTLRETSSILGSNHLQVWKVFSSCMPKTI